MLDYNILNRNPKIMQKNQRDGKRKHHLCVSREVLYTSFKMDS